MKKNLFLTIVLATTLLFASYNAIAQGRIELGRSAENSVTLHSSSMAGFCSTFSFNSIESKLISNEKGEFSEIYIDGSFPYGEVGSPELPMITRLIVIPDGAKPTVKVGGYSESEHKLSDYGIGKLAAMQPPIRKNVDPNTVEYTVNKAAYARNSYNSDEIATVEYLGTMRGIGIGKLTVCPVRYNPVSGTVKVYNDIEVKVDFKNANEASTRSMFAATYSPAFNSVYDQLFNIDMLMGGSGKDAYTDHPDLYNTPVKMLVICYSDFQGNSALNEWLQWKLQKGYYVDIFYTDVTGTSASNIASFIKTKYNASVSSGNAYSYLIVIGDTDQVTYYDREYESDISDYCALDLGYSSINYSSNSSNYFPDMHYSRISVQNETNLNNYINKVLTYERYEFTDGGNYLNNVVLVGGWDNSWTPKVAKPTINYATNNYFNSSNTTYGGFSGGTINATISSGNYFSCSTPGYNGSNNGCYNGINNGVCFINYTAHGDRQMWYEPEFNATQVASLTNTGKYFFGIGNCCLSGNFNNTTTDYSPGSTIGNNACFAEAMIRVANAGAIAYIGCSEESLWYEDYYWAVGAHSYSQGNAPSTSTSTMGAYDAMFTDQYWNSASSVLYVGNLAVQQAINSNYTNSGSSYGAKYYFKFYHTFGDGSVMPYITKPETNNVTIPATIEPNATSMTVNAVKGSYVAVTNNTNTIYGVGIANNSGVATVQFTNAIPSSGNLYVVVTRQQYQPYFGTVEVRSSSSISVTATATPSIIARGSSSTLKATATGGTNYTYSWTPSSTLSNANIQQPTATPTQTTTYTVTVSSNGDSNTANVTVQVVTPPTNLTATAVGCGSGVKLTWTAPSLATSYKIYRNNTLIASNVTATEYTDSNLSAGTYSYQVAAVYQSVESKSTAVSQTLEGASGPCECEVVFSLRDSYGDGWNGSTLTISFDDGTTAQTLDFPKSANYSYSNRCDTLKIYTLTINQGTNVSVVFNSGSSYDSECFLNIAYDGGEEIYSCNANDLTNSGGQTIATFQTDCGSTVTTECYAPINLTATAETSSIALTWTASSTATSYRIYRNGTSIANDITGTSYTDNTAVVGTTYTYTVKANCTNGNLSDASNSATATITGDSNQCDAPTGLAVTANGDKATITWNTQSSSTYTINDNFESHTAFAINSTGTAGWTYIDGDGSETGTISDYNDWTNAHEAMAYIVFNPSQVTPESGSGNLSSSIIAHSGSQFLASFYATTPPNNDWIVSPQLNFSAPFTFSFYYRGGHKTAYTESFEVYYSTTTDQQSAFTNQLDTETAPGSTSASEWTQKTYTVPSTAKYVAIRCTSNDQYYFCIDDISISGAVGSGSTAVNIYDGNTLIASNVTGGSYTANNLSTGQHCFSIRGICDDNSESAPAEMCVNISGGSATTHTVTLNAGTGGTISPSGTQTVNDGSSLTFTVSADQCYTIASVKVNGTTVTLNANNSYTIANIHANQTVNATFSYDTSCDDCNVYHEFNKTACEEFIWNGVPYNTSGNYTQTFNIGGNCDSIVTLHLTIGTPEVTITGDESIELGSSVTLTASGAETYVWNNGETTASINVSPGETTTYSVTGTDANGCTGTAEFTVNVDGIGETVSTVSIFPNPVKQIVTVKANNIERIRVFDLTGQLLLEANEKSDQIQIDMNGYSAGHYFMQVTTKSGIVTEKVIKR